MPTSILEVSGVGPSTAVILAENGIRSAEELAAQTPAQLATVRTFSLTRAARVIANAKAAVAAGVEPAAEPKPTKTAKKKIPQPKTGEKAKKKEKAAKDKGKKAKKNKKSKEKSNKVTTDNKSAGAKEKQNSSKDKKSKSQKKKKKSKK